MALPTCFALFYYFSVRCEEIKLHDNYMFDGLPSVPMLGMKCSHVGNKLLDNIPPFLATP